MGINQPNAAVELSDTTEEFEEEAQDAEPLEGSEDAEGKEEKEEPEEPQEPELPLTAKLSSVLFVSPKPLSVTALAEAVRADEEEVEAGLRTLQDIFQDMVHGFALHRVGDLWELRTSPLAKDAVQRLIPPRSRRLSRAAAETLAVIAYRQPVQRAEIEAIRGVDALPTLKTLLDARLIRIVGREESPGHPALYGTTQTFLEKFGLEDLSQLPTPKEMEQLLQEPGESEPSAADEESSVNAQAPSSDAEEGGNNGESDNTGQAGEGSEVDEQEETAQEAAKID